MNRAEQVQLIRQSCLAANPELAAAIAAQPNGMNQIGLSDVVTALGKHHELSGGGLMKVINCWDLCKSALCEQSDECVATVAHLMSNSLTTVWAGPSKETADACDGARKGH